MITDGFFYEGFDTGINGSQSGSRNYYVLNWNMCTRVRENRVERLSRLKILLSLELEFSW